MIYFAFFINLLATPADFTAILAPLEGTPPDIANALPFNAFLICGPPPEGGFNLDDAGKFGVDFIFLVLNFNNFVIQM
jgi:hypothetical protein